MSKKKRNKKSKPLLKNKSNKAEISSSNSIPHLWYEYISKYFYPLLIGIAAAIMALWSWGTWCDPMVDFGRELYVPWQITIGKTLYTDLAYFNGPLSPYFNSIWFSLFGVHLRSILFINFLILACVLFFSYKMLKEIGSRTGATLGCLVIITVFAFAKYHFIGGYNFIAPYSHEMTHGLLLSFMGIWCLSTYQRQNKRYLIFFLGVFLGLVFLTKAEFAVAAVFSTITGFLLLLWFQKEPWKYNVIKLTLFLLGIIMPLLIAFLLLYTHMSSSNAITGLLGSWIGIVKTDLREMIFYRQLMGVDNLAGNIKIMFVSFGLLVLVYVPVVTFSLMNQLSKKQDAIIGLILLAGTILASIFFINFLVSLGPFMLRSLPLILLSLIVIEVIRLRLQYRQSFHDTVTILRLTLLLFALLLLLKLFFRVDPSQYGFALAMPGTIILVLLLVDWLPASLEQKGKTGNILRLFSIGIILIFCGIHTLISGFWYNKTIVEIKTDTASFYADVRGNIVQNIIKEIENHTSPEDTLAVLPEGVMLNFLTQRKNPTPYINFMPPEFALFGESSMLNAFQTNSPDYIVLTNKSLKEYGFQETGIDIGANLYQWIEKNYALVKYIGLEYESNLPFTRMRLLHRIQPKNSSHLNPVS